MKRRRFERIKIGKYWYYTLDYKRQGIGGVIRTKPTPRKEDRRATAWEGYAVLFFPQINGIGKASVHYHPIHETLSCSMGPA